MDNKKERTANFTDLFIKRVVSSSVLSNYTTLLDVQVSNKKLIWAKIEF